MAIELIPLIPGAISSSIAVINFSRQFKKTSIHGDIRKAIESRNGRVRNKDEEEEYFIDALDFSNHLVGPLQNKIIMALLISLTTIFAIGVGYFREYISTPGTTTTLEVFLIIIQALTALSANSSLILNQDEKAFLNNLSILRKWFYDTYVFEAIVDFNRELSNRKTFKNLKANSNFFESRIRRVIREEVKNNINDKNI